MRPGDPCELQFLKHPATPHWRHEAVYMGEDTHGVWLGAPSGSVAQRGDEPPRRIRHHQVHLAPRGKWWVLTYSPHHPKATLWADISTPPEIRAGQITAVDLDLDVIRSPAGEVWVDDEDEFATHQVDLGYTREMIHQARRATDGLVRAFKLPDEPFATIVDAWLARLEDEISRLSH